MCPVCSFPTSLVRYSTFLCQAAERLVVLSRWPSNTLLWVHFRCIAGPARKGPAAGSSHVPSPVARLFFVGCETWWSDGVAPDLSCVSGSVGAWLVFALCLTQRSVPYLLDTVLAMCLMQLLSGACDEFSQQLKPTTAQKCRRILEFHRAL